MTRDDLKNSYFRWLCALVYGKRRNYRKLLTRLHSIDFTYIVDMDSNRAEDGINLRYRFGVENGFEEAMVASYLDDRPCSVLETLVALALRCEEHIMSNLDMGNRTHQWFWNMIESLGLSDMNDENFDREYVDSAVDIFMNRKYALNGRGGLFTLKDGDARKMEILHQMYRYLNENFYNE